MKIVGIYKLVSYFLLFLLLFWCLNISTGTVMKNPGMLKIVPNYLKNRKKRKRKKKKRKMCKHAVQKLPFLIR